tara:strand:- start:6366 stop:6677 length:312 start_codon:yes stop_codon:yes gene_type:complete
MFFKNTELVQSLLEKNISNRDCDRRLYANVVYIQAVHNGYDPNTMTLMEFLERFVEAEVFAHPESIRRIRAKLQENREDLRGEKYLKRHNKIKQGVEKELGYE